MKTRSFRSWNTFRRELSRYAALPEDRRNQLIFRGQGLASFDLLPTLDRLGRKRRDWKSDAARQQAADDLLENFKNEATLASQPEPADLEDEALELLARHHALPSPLLDFTRSPFIATYFAYANCRDRQACAVWQLDRSVLPENLPELRVIEDPMLIRFNARALRQRGVFVRLGTGSSPLTELVGDAVTRYTLPASSRIEALAELDEMGINAASLFGDLDSVARTAAGRSGW
ncbi:MAG: FRG domain-containing protein [Planctomycetota bacterium]